MDEELQSSPHTQPIEKVARKSRNTLVIIQIVMASLLGMVLICLVIGGYLILNNRSTLQDQVNQNTQDRIGISNALKLQKEEQQRIDSALCDNQYTVATVPVPKNGGKILVQFVESSRKAFVVLQCPGKLPPPSQSLLIAGSRNDIPIRY